MILQEANVFCLLTCSWLAILVLLAYMAMVVVILLNVLIAQLSFTYSEAKNNAKLQYAIDRMFIVTRLEHSRFASFVSVWIGPLWVLSAVRKPLFTGLDLITEQASFISMIIFLISFPSVPPESFSRVCALCFRTLCKNVFYGEKSRQPR